MTVQLMKLRGVPEDELEELYELLDAHEIDYYETDAGNWGISLPALWLADDSQYDQARALLDTYERERYERVRSAYEADKAAGRQRTFLAIVREKPLTVVLYLGIIAVLIYLSTVPFLGVGAE